VGALVEIEAVNRELRRPALVDQAPSFSEVQFGYRPGWTLLSSFTLQVSVLALFFLFGRYAFFQHVITVRPRLVSLPSRSANIVNLPKLGGGSEGSGPAGGGSGRAGPGPRAHLARSRRGFAYPGPQPMISSPPKATLGIETILRPSLKNLPHLRHFVDLPNIVRPPHDPSPRVDAWGQALLIKPEASARDSQGEKASTPKINLPGAFQEQNYWPEKIETTPARQEGPRPSQNLWESATSDKRTGLLVLNAVPPPPDVTGKIPEAEARSLFAVSPAESTIIAEPSAGTKGGGAVSMPAGNGGRTDIRSGDAVAEIATGGEATNYHGAGSGAGEGGHYGNAQGSGLSSVGNTSGAGRGSHSGSGLGTGSASGAGSGTGGGSAPGVGGFAGITIQGGQYGNSGNALVKPESHRQDSYNMTIVSTAGSGGLPDLGVFRNEKVYTVYLDMRSGDDNAAPSWILQYSVLHQGNSLGDVVPIQGTPTPPYAILKAVPQFAPKVIHQGAHRLILISGMLDTGGRLQQLSVKQTPESELIGPLIEGLQDWMFEPAKIDGRPVALKVLLGIRLATAQ
jgi:hypothetical protein